MNPRGILQSFWMRAHKPSEALAQPIAQLERHASGLASLSTSIEHRFLELSADFESLTVTTRQLASECERLLLLASGEEGGEAAIHSTVALLEGPLKFTLQWKHDSEGLLVRLREALQIVEELTPVEEQVRQTLGALPCIQILFQIETARMSADVREVFGKVGHEIQLLLGQVNEAFAKQFQSLTRMQASLREVVAETSAGVAAEYKAVEEQQRGIATALSMLEADIGKREDLRRHFVDKAKALSEHAAQIVVAIQAQDRVAQRLEHVRKALTSITSLGRQLASISGNQLRAVMTSLQKASRVESEQVRQAAADITSAREMMQASLESFSNHIREVRHDGLENVPETSASVCGSVQVLLDTTGDMRRLMTSVKVAAEAASQRVLPIAAYAESLTGTVGELAQRMRLIALNAQVNAVSIGDHSGLEVLSAEAARISEETTQICTAAGEAITRLHDSLDGNLRQFGELAPAASQAQDRLLNDGQGNDAQLHQFRDSTLSALTAAGTLAGTAHETTQSMLRLLDFDKPVGEKAAEVQRTLQEIERLAGVWLEHRRAEDATHELAALERNYTMAEERRVHALVVGSKSMPGAPATASAGQDAQSSGEIEMF